MGTTTTTVGTLDCPKITGAHVDVANASAAPEGVQQADPMTCGGMFVFDRLNRAKCPPTHSVEPTQAECKALANETGVGFKVVANPHAVSGCFLTSQTQLGDPSLNYLSYNTVSPAAAHLMSWSCCIQQCTCMCSAFLRTGVCQWLHRVAGPNAVLGKLNVDDLPDDPLASSPAGD